MPVISEFLRNYPDLSIQHFLDNRQLEYVSAGIDLGLRIGNLPDSGLRQLKLGEVRVVTCASPDYLEKCGSPESPFDLGRFRTVAFGPSGERSRWNYLIEGAGEEWIDITPVYSVNSLEAIVRLVLDGGGIGKFYSYQVADLVEKNRLKVILEDFELTPRPVCFLYPDIAHMPRRTRTFLDFAAVPVRDQLEEIGRRINL